MLALVMVGSAMLIAMVLGKVFGWDIGLTAGMLAGDDLHPGAGGRGGHCAISACPAISWRSRLTI
jgi:hypothetical protein